MLKKCATVISQLVDTLPLLLSRVEPEIAAQIVATLARSVVNTTSLKIVPQEEDPMKEFERIIKEFSDRCDDEDEPEQYQKDKYPTQTADTYYTRP
jgi:hypothetical protein